jgi:hypothetical protein
MRKLALLMLFVMALAIGSTGFIPGLMPVAHAFPTGPVDHGRGG